MFADGDKWEDRWVYSEHKSDLGKFKLSSGKFYHDENDKGESARQVFLFTQFNNYFFRDQRT